MRNGQRMRRVVAPLVMALALAGVAGCAPGSPASAESGASAASSAGQSADMSSAYQEAFSGQNMVSTFIGEEFYDGTVTNEEEALAAIKSVYSRIGADDTTDLQINSIRPTETGTSYYIFNQKAGDVQVYGASVKLVTNKENKPEALVSAILPNVALPKAENWEISAEQAEKIVVDTLAAQGHPGMSVVEGATEQAIIAIPNNDSHNQYAWVVYTDNYDTDSEMGYLAHYVDANSDYLYALPIAEPHNADALTGDKPNFDFSKYQPETWTGTVTLHDGSTKEITVPVLVDSASNTQLLGDAQRKILCADYAQWNQQDILAPRTSDNASFDNVELIAYEAFIQVWDFFAGIGWTGPDGEGTPTLLLMDYVNAQGEPVDSAFYNGRKNGFQVFAFNRLNPDGENIDVVAHEFTHCITDTTMTTNIYRNETGAVNEGMSDVLGNLVEMMLTNRPETAWLIGDSSGGGTLRSMKDPHEFQQPAFRWDTYYTPSVTTGTELNDRGGVHRNSSLLNVVSYKLDQAGMKPEEQAYFWMNVALAMTPCTDYEQLAQLLPWCLKQSGYSSYVEALQKAIADEGYATVEAPATPPAGSGAVRFIYPAEAPAEQGLTTIVFMPVTEESAPIATWPAAGTREVICNLPAGTYQVMALAGSEDNPTRYWYTGTDWKLQEGEDSPVDVGEEGLVQVKEGETIELVTTGLPEQVELPAQEQAPQEQ